MSVTVEMHNTGNPPERGEILALIEHLFSDRLGDWKVSLIGSRADGNWEIKVEGPMGFERSYTLVGASMSSQPEIIRAVLLKLMPAG